MHPRGGQGTRKEKHFPPTGFPLNSSLVGEQRDVLLPHSPFPPLPTQSPEECQPLSPTRVGRAAVLWGEPGVGWGDPFLRVALPGVAHDEGHSPWVSQGLQCSVGKENSRAVTHLIPSPGVMHLPGGPRDSSKMGLHLIPCGPKTPITLQGPLRWFPCTPGEP